MLVQGKKVIRPDYKDADYVRTVKQMVDAVNSINPDLPYHDWFAPDPSARAAVHFKNGKHCVGLSAASALHGGTVEDNAALNLRINSFDGKIGGVYAEGPGRCVVNGAAITLAGDSTGIGGPATGAAVKNGAELVLTNVLIDTSGATHYATVAERSSTLRVSDSVIISHGAPYGDGQPQPTGIMQTPPPSLRIDGNGRTHCTMTNSHSYFDRCLITCDGWGALSTETAEGFAFLEANDCRIITVRRGYGTYVDPGCHVFLNRCETDSADMAGIIGGQGELVLRDCDTMCGSMGLLMHSVGGAPEETSEVKILGGSFLSEGPAILIRSDNARITLENSEILSKENVLIRTQVNDDPIATPVGENPFGIEVHLRAMDAQGDILHEDTEREMYLYFESTTLHGTVRGAHIGMDTGSKWFADSDSEVTLMNDVNAAQLDAPEGVTIRIRCGQSGKETLASGGTLELLENQNER